MNAVFTNDGYVSFKLLKDHWYSNIMQKRDAHEKIFRRIHTYLILKNVIKKNILDSGAWIGDNSIPWSLNISKERKVFAIDPSLDNISFIERTAELNGITNIVTIKTALSDKEETIGTDDDIHHANFSKGGEKYKIDAVPLDKLYAEGKIYDIDFMHLDVENMEYKVVVGAEKLIDTLNPIVTFEQHLQREDYMTLVNWFKSKSYTVYVIEEILLGCFPDCRNIIALPKRVLEGNPLIREDITKFIGYGCLRIL